MTDLADADRFEEEYACPECGYHKLSSPTYRQRRCGSCGHRGSEQEFRVTPDQECPECGTIAPKTHEHKTTSIYTCRSCYNQFPEA